MVVCFRISITQNELLLLARKSLPELTKLEEATVVDCDSSYNRNRLRVYTSSLENIPVIAVSSETLTASDTFACDLAEPILIPPRRLVGRLCNFQHCSLVCRDFPQ